MLMNIKAEGIKMGNRMACAVLTVILLFSGCTLFNPPTPEEGIQPISTFYFDGWETFGKDIKQTPDGGFIVVGFIESYPNRNTLLMKLDAFGSITWQKQYELTYNTLAVECRPEGGYVLAGLDYSDNMYFIMKVDADGNSQEIKKIGNQIREFKGIIRISDGYIIYGSGGNKGAMAKFDSDGNSLWAINLSDFYNSRLHETRIMTDGSYLASGTVYSLSSYPDYLFLSKVTAEGVILWTRYYNVLDTDTDCHDAAEIGSGSGYIAAVDLLSMEMDHSRFAVLKFNSNGDFERELRMGGGYPFSAATQIMPSAGNFIVGGGMAPMGEDIQYAYVTKINSNLETLWSVKMKGDSPRHSGETRGNYIIKMCATSDGGVAFTGYCAEVSDSNREIFVARLRANGLRMW